jgi:hypothetical protein
LLGSEQWRTLSQIEAFIKKNESLPSLPTVDTGRAALESFERAERICRITNRRLAYYFDHEERMDPNLSKWMKRAARFVENCLGPVDEFVEAIPQLVRLTSGATSTRARKDALPFMKVSKTPVCTPSAEPLLRSLYAYFGVKLRNVRLVAWNRVIVVTKNWKTGRTIAAEPEGNLPFQLAFDTFVKGCLRKVGINLSSQRRNQQYAAKASVDDAEATVDFTMASDTGARLAVHWLYPPKWVELLERFRTPLGRLDPGLASDYPEFDKVWQYAKFSSMGNGCTFGLETLIFASLAYAVGSRTICVYGDDVVVDADKYDDFTRLAKFLGFVVNHEKSYASGPFRESCGENYYRGTLVTPFYVREWHDEMRKADRCHVVNGLAKVSLPGGKLWTLLRSIVKDDELPLVPYCENSTAGVHIDVYLARDRGLIKPRREYVTIRHREVADPDEGRLYKAAMRVERRLVVDNNAEMYKAYVPVASSVRVSDARTKALWFLQAIQMDLSKEEERSPYSPRTCWLDKGFRPRGARESTLVPIISSHVGYKRDWVALTHGA